MKSLVVSFDDEEFELLKQAKGDRTWREWLLESAKNGVIAKEA